MKALRTIGSWWKRAKPDRRYAHTIFLDSRHEMPDNPQADTLYVVGARKAPKWLIFDCPCDCGHRLEVNLMRARKPSWRLSVSVGKKLSVFPSLWVVGDMCDSHFWLKNNTVYFVREIYR